LATSLRTASLMASLLLTYSPSATSLSRTSTSFWSSFVGIARLMKHHHSLEFIPEYKKLSEWLRVIRCGLLGIFLVVFGVFGWLFLCLVLW